MVREYDPAIFMAPPPWALSMRLTNPLVNTRCRANSTNQRTGEQRARSRGEVPAKAGTHLPCLDRRLLRRKRGVKINPVRVIPFDQVDLPVPLPFLDLPLADERAFKR